VFVVGAVALTVDRGLKKNRFKTHGRIVAAEIVEFRPVQPAKSASCKTAVYQFSLPDGKTYFGATGCDRLRTDNLGLGSIIEVTYLPDFPDISLPGTFEAYSLWNDIFTSFVIASSAAVLLLGLGALLVRAISGQQRF
jgi:hypothetical protein